MLLVGAEDFVGKGGGDLADVYFFTVTVNSILNSDIMLQLWRS